jgi:hypothetical protein
MAVTYKDIDQLTQKANPTGTEKLPVSDTEYITPQQIAGMVPLDEFADENSENAVKNVAICRRFMAGVPIDHTSEVLGKFMKHDGSGETTAGNYAYRKFPVTPGETYSFCVRFYTGYTTGQIRAVLWFDANDNFLKAEEYANSYSESMTYCDYLVVAPADAAYAIVNFRKEWTMSGLLKHVAPPHPSCLKYVLLADEAAYNALATKDPGTLYLIPES